MSFRLRTAAVYAIAISLALTNGFASGHAHARHGQAVVSSGDQHAAHSHSHHGLTDSHDNNASELVVLGQEDDRHDPSASPVQICCVATCSAMAFVSETFSFDSFLPDMSFELALAPIFTARAVETVTPPPR